MRILEFTLILTSEPNEQEADQLYRVVDDGTLATVEGMPQIRFHREALSLEEAIGSALLDVTKVGFDILRVEIEPEVVGQRKQIFQTEQLPHRVV